MMTSAVNSVGRVWILRGRALRFLERFRFENNLNFDDANGENCDSSDFK